MKRKHHAPTGADYPRKRKQSKTKEITVPSNTRDVPLSTIFVRLLNDITNKNSYQGSKHKLQPQLLQINEVFKICFSILDKQNS